MSPRYAFRFLGTSSASFFSLFVAITTQNYTEKQAGVLFFVFGMSQFLFQTPAGYLYDYTEQKILWLSTAAVATTLLTLLTAFFAAPYGSNLSWMIFIKFLQGAVTSFIPPGLNSITQGIVGSGGMTTQVATNEMMNHLGTAIIVLCGSLLGLALYPSLGLLFVVSPIACAGVIYFLNRIKPEDIDHDAARGLDKTETSSLEGYKAPEVEEPKEENKNLNSQPSFNFGWQSIAQSAMSGDAASKADSPLRVLRDPVLLTFVFIVFLFHLSNGTVLPLVMQTLAIGSGRAGIFMSGLCIIVAQFCMVVSAKICGDYSGRYGRKTIFLAGLSSVPLRCLILTVLVAIRGEGQVGSPFMQFVILSTQILDGVGAGVFGTMYILVTSDISGGTGRFSMTLGITTAAMSIGGTVSGYLGEALAEDYGYQSAFFILMFMSMVPAALYLFFMPETLPALAKGVDPNKTIEMIKEEDEKATEGAYKELI